MDLPLFKKAGEVLGAQIWHVDHEFNPLAAKPPERPPSPEEPADSDAPLPSDPDEG
jgi:hypothetical protein